MHSLCASITTTSGSSSSSSAIFSLLLLALTLSPLAQSAPPTCPPFSCNPRRHDTIQFPFHAPLNQTSLPTSRCGYPGFDLACNSTRTILSLSSEPLVVRGIDYVDQLLWLSDPNACSPSLALALALALGPDLGRTPFSFGPDAAEYTLLNCSGPGRLPPGAAEVGCMSGGENGNFTVLLAFRGEALGALGRDRGCRVVRKTVLPLWWPEFGYGYYPADMSDVMLELSWDVPGCGDCVLRGGTCGFVSDNASDDNVGCFLPPATGLPRSAKYGLILGVGIPGILCMIGLTFYISGRLRARNLSRRLVSIESSPAVFPQPMILTLGLDRPTIESYPKTVLGESKRLPKPSDAICPICLSEYQPKETLRSIPECNHYFHAECIDEWLRMNATCPLCRNSPQ